MLTIAQMESLLAPNRKIKGKTTNALVRTRSEGNEGYFNPNDNDLGKLEAQTVKSSQFQRFEGKMGTKRRSRKGMVRTMPNGWVRYNNDTEIEVVAYKV